MTIYQGEGKGAAHTIEQKEVFVQFREEARGGRGAAGRLCAMGRRPRSGALRGAKSCLLL